MNDGLLTEQQNTYMGFYFSSDTFGPFLMFPPDSMVCSTDFMLETVWIQIFVSLFFVDQNIQSQVIISVNLLSSKCFGNTNEQMHVDTVFKMLILTLKDI